MYLIVLHTPVQPNMMSYLLYYNCWFN